MPIEIAPKNFQDLMVDYSDDARMSPLLACFYEYLTTDEAHARSWRAAAAGCFNSAIQTFYKTPPSSGIPYSKSYDLLHRQKETFLFFEKCPDGVYRKGFAIYRFECILNQYFDRYGKTMQTLAYILFIAFSLAIFAAYRHPRQKKRTAFRFCAACAPHRFGTLRCARCGKAYYCSKTCQHAQWGWHKKSCSRAVVCVD